MKTRALVLLAIAVGLCGCVTDNQTVIAYNGTSRILSGFYIHSSSGFGFTYGSFNPGISKSCRGRIVVRSTDQCDVTWNDSDNKSHAVNLDLSKHLPRGFRGNLLFTVTTNGNVTVKPDTGVGPK